MTRTGRDRDRLRVERDLREAERVLAHLRGISLDEAAQALKVHAVLAGTSVIEVARDVIAHRPVIRPRVLRSVTDLDGWAATGRGDPAPADLTGLIPEQRTSTPRDD
ncbi:hypothetical protein ACQPX6_00535 [Actinomycetospora sp. CA-101289]|uniref:hypothetical protein n=1 Tax=Actinomycetospora sp. CA-101289 TaxID=3239893 RepID=UPI003D972FAB